MSRYDLSYKYSLDNGINWIDITEIVDSSQTSIVHNLCTAGFKSATDTASFTIPASDTALKQNLVNALLGTSSIMATIYEGATILFTGYVNKDNISIRSYPLTASISIELEDVSTLKLDDSVNAYIYLKGKTITEIVHALLDKAGYTYDNSSLLTADEKTIEAFVIDKDDSDSYRDYIDTLLFEAGGYVLDFNASGVAQIVKIDWQASGTASVVDNPMISDGVTTKTSVLNEDGVSLKWASTKWSEDSNQLLWQDSISRSLDDGYVVGEDVENQRYWPDGGELSPVYQEYNSDLLDSDYLTNATRKQNSDLAIIVAEDVRAEIQATKNKVAFTDWKYPIIADFIDDYELTTNPVAFPKKAWYLLYNESGATVNIQHFRLYGKVFYKDKQHTLKTKETKNPKEYESKYIYNETHANQFVQFYWHFMQTSRTSVSWKEVDSERTLGDVVQIYHKGSLSTIKAVIAGITTTFVGRTKITSYTAVGVAAQIIPYPTLASTKLKGATSAENKGIHEIKVMYATSTTQEGTKSDWQSTIPTLSYSNRYLWQKETIYYTDGTSEDFIEIISVFGETGNGIKSITEYYATNNDSATVPADSEFKASTVPTISPTSRCLWNYKVVEYTDNTTKPTSKGVIGMYGDTGDPGKEGKGIKSITPWYLATDKKTGVTRTGTSGWTTTIQSVTVDLKYLWSYTETTYTEGDPSYSDAVIIGTYGDTGKDGEPGKDGSSVEVQYSYSPSADTCYDEFIQWSDFDVYWGTEQALWNTWLANSPAEKEGYYIWMRARIGTADWQYTRLTGVQAKLFNLKCSQSTLTRNDRNETQGTVTFECDIQGYVDYTPSLTINGEEVALSISEGVYYYVYNYYYKNARSIEAKLFNGHELMDTVILDAVDETPPVAYIGVQDELPTKNGDLLLLEGDSCVYLGAVYIYQSVGGWKKTTESTLSQTARAQALTWAMNDVLKNIKDGSITATEYAYFKNVVANIITASYIGSKTIELQEGGYIQSQGFNPDTSEKGFRLDYDGVLQTVRAIMKDVTINDGTLNAGALKTVNADTLGSWCATCGMPSENGKWSGVIKVVNEQGSSETVGTLNVTRTCYYNVKEWAQWFLDNVPVNNTAFTKLTGTIDGYNVYAMRFSQETWAQVFAQTCSWEIAEKSKSWEWTVSWEQYYKDLKIVIKNISQLTLAKSLTVSVDGVVKSTSASEGTITISQLSSGTHTISITVDTNKFNSGTFSVVASTSITSVYAGRLYKNATSGISSDRILLMLYSGTDDSIVFEGGTASNTLRVCSINSDSYPNGKMTNALYWESSFGDYYHTLATSLEKGGNSLICGSGYDDWNIQHYTQFAPLYEVGAYDSSTGAVVWKSTPSVKKACSYKVSNVFINGILHDKDFTVTWTGSVFNLASDDGTVNITYSTSEYYTSLSYISYAEVAESKGAYVASLYPIEKDVSDIGSVNQKFDTAYINTVHSDTVYGAKFSSTTLCNTTSTGTITLPDALTNYEWITMYVSYGGSAGLTGNVATFHSSNWSNWQTNNGILLFGDISNSSSKTYTVQITSATQLTATTSSVGFTLTVIGYK